MGIRHYGMKHGDGVWSKGMWMGRGMRYGDGAGDGYG